jgi:ATP-binding cassette subfamily B protein
MSGFPFYRQLDRMDCGPACLRMIAEHFGRRYSLESLRQKMFLNREGVSLLAISDAAESIGMHTLAVKISFERLFELDLPAVISWDQNHFVVLYKITRRKVFIADPAVGKVTYTHDEFKRHWISMVEEGEEKGVALAMEPTPTFFEREGEEVKRSSFRFLFKHLFQYKRFIVQLFLGLLVGSILQLIFPFLTQSIVDYGINYKDINFITLILVAQLMLFISSTAVNFIRSWILLHIGTRVNISILSDFLIKLMKSIN